MPHKILLVGKIPPPIGGIGIHLTRLMEHLTDLGISYTYLYLSNRLLPKIIWAMLFHRVLHLNTSSPYIRAAFAILGKVLFCKVLISYHGDLGRFNPKKNKWDYFSVRYCDIPIVLNENSLVKAKSLNSKSISISSFIPPISISFDKDIQRLLKEFVKKYEFSFCTNAYNTTMDSAGREVYGITDVVKTFQNNFQWGLVFSDPSGDYTKFLKKNNIEITDNIFIINYPHDFMSVLDTCNAFIRATTTDGDSLSVKEALYLKKHVVASDCVSRPNEVTLYKEGNWKEFENTLKKVTTMEDLKESTTSNGALGLIKLYKTLYRAV